MATATVLNDFEVSYMDTKYLYKDGCVYTIRNREDDEDYDADEEWKFSVWRGEVVQDAEVISKIEAAVSLKNVAKPMSSLRLANGIIANSSPVVKATGELYNIIQCKSDEASRDCKVVTMSPPATLSSHPWSHILKHIQYGGERRKAVLAKHIKEAKKTWTGEANQFEPRLLAYYPSHAACPQALKDHGLNLLPVKNGEYLLLKERIYQPLSYRLDEIQSVPKDTSSALLGIGSSESSVIDNLRYSGVFERDEILGEPITHGSLLNGRHFTGKFSFQIGEETVDVSSVQYEIDACFESRNKILILEGKSSGKEIDSFNIRQLYYPYRVLQSKVQGSKQFLCGFIHELKGVIHVWLYTFDVPERMDSIRQVGYHRYSLM